VGKSCTSLHSAVLACWLAVFLSAACLGRADGETACLLYEPSVVTLKGTLIRKTFPGPPNYESVRKGDRPETYWLVELADPVCVDKDPKDPDLGPAHNDIRIVQLVVEPKLYKSHASLIGRHVVATGTLFGAISGHHHTPVLLSVRTLAGAR
jgi:hypothetical protein